MCDHTCLVLVAQGGYRSGAKREEAARLGRQAQPAARQDAQNVSVGEQEYVTEAGLRTVDDGLSPGCDLVDSFAAWYSVAPRGPAGLTVPDFESGEPFIVPVIPLTQIRVEHRGVAITGKATSFNGTLQGAGQYKRERAATKEPADLGGALPALEGKRQVSPSRVPACGAPLGFTVTYKPHFDRCHGILRGFPFQSSLLRFPEQSGRERTPALFGAKMDGRH